MSRDAVAYVMAQSLQRANGTYSIVSGGTIAERRVLRSRGDAKWIVRNTAGADPSPPLRWQHR